MRPSNTIPLFILAVLVCSSPFPISREHIERGLRITVPQITCTVGDVKNGRRPDPRKRFTINGRYLNSKMEDPRPSSTGELYGDWKALRDRSKSICDIEGWNVIPKDYSNENHNWDWQITGFALREKAANCIMDVITANFIEMKNRITPENCTKSSEVYLLKPGDRGYTSPTVRNGLGMNPTNPPSGSTSQPPSLFREGATLHEK